MGSIGLAIIYGFKVNVSVAIVAMVNHTAVKLSTLRQLESGNATNVITDIADQCHHHDISSNTTKITTEVYNLSSNFIKITNHEFVESFSRKNFWKKFRELNELFFFFFYLIYLKDGPFVWNEPLQGLILSSYFWGYMVSLLPGGRMAELLSAKWVMNGSVLLNVVASILSPVAAQTHYSLFIVMRFLQGIGGVSRLKLFNI